MNFPRNILLLLLAFSMLLQAQQSTPPPTPLTLEGAVNYALAHYPQIRASLERRSAASAGVGLAKTAYLPTGSALWQGNRATRNNIFGLLLPQSVIAPISGPVLPDTSNRGIWGSASGVLVSWEPLDFGYRRAGVDAARAGERTASAELDISRLDVASATASAFISVIEAQQAIRAADADVNRREVFSRSVHVLVQNQLRPGADASRADAELAAARIGMIQARTAEKVARIALSDLLGISPTSLQLDAGALMQGPPALTTPQIDVAAHPAAVAQHSRVDQAAAQVRVLDRSYYPRFDLQSAFSGRGSGANNDGTFAGGTNGLGLQRENWAVGLTASFPFLDFFSIRSRKQIASATERAETARYQQTVQDLSAQAEEAQARLEGAIAIAQTTAVELDAARAAESQARARYEAALTNVVEVTDAEGLLVRAETDDAVSRLNAWLALAAFAAAQGDLTPFLQSLHNASTGGH
ncbi:MAG TPA: TolC family protein [Terriglobales bacterium]|nr:TolC family protein [Terriglobales bacterium]